MKKIYALLLALFLLAPFVRVEAEKTYVIDEIGILSSDEKAALEEKYSRLSDELNVDIVAVITYSTNKSAMDYADDYFDYEGYGRGANGDGALFLLYVEEYDGDEIHGEYWISTKGSGIRAYTDVRIDEAGDKIVNYLRYGDVYGALNSFADSSEYYFKRPTGTIAVDADGKTYHYDDYGNLIPDKSPEEQKMESFGFATVGSATVGALVALIRTLINKAKLKTVHKKNEAHDYIKAGSFVLDPLGTRDIFLHRSVTRTRIESSSSSGGGGSSSIHTSSSGSTHGGGGGRF